MNKARISKVKNQFGTRFSIKEQSLFAKRMSFLVKAGVPLVDCLNMIRAQTKSKAKGRVFDMVIDDVNNGQFLATSLGKHRRMFGDFAINLIHVGEQSGILSQNLAYLADELQKKETLRKKVIGALVYPIVITIATLGITGVLTVYIFPKILPIFASLNVTLPLSTRILIAISNFLTNDGLWLLLGVIVLAGSLAYLKFRFQKVQYFFDRSSLKVPIFGSMLQNYNLANFTRTLGLLLKSGVQLTDSMVMVAEATPNLAYRKAFENIATSIVRGEPMSRELARDPALFPDTLRHMVTVGETTGGLSDTLLYLSEMHESEVEEATKNLSSTIEPLLMVVMGCLVGFIAVSIITPIYEITQSLHP